MNITENDIRDWGVFIETLGLNGAALELLRNTQIILAEINDHEDHGKSVWVAVDLQDTAVRMLAVPAVIEKVADAIGQKLEMHAHFEVRCRAGAIVYMATNLHPSKLQRH